MVTNTETLAQVKTGAHLTSTNGAVGVNAASKDKLIDVLAAASASGGGTSVAATLGVLNCAEQTTAQVDAGAVLSGNNDVSVISSGKTWMLVLGKSLSATPSQNAVGATIGVCVPQRTIKALVGANAPDIDRRQRSGAGERRKLGADAHALRSRGFHRC